MCGMNNFFQTHKAPILIGLVAIGLYAGTLFHSYSYDDFITIVGNSFTESGISGVLNIFMNDAFAGVVGDGSDIYPGGRYRPMAQAFFALEYELFGLNPFVGHLMNVFFYALLCVLVFVVLRRLFAVETHCNASLQVKWYFSLPFIAAMLFAIHPLHVDAVANIKNRDEIFVLLGALGALYFSLNYVKRVNTCVRVEPHDHVALLWVFLSFLFALFSKENALTFLAIIPLTLYSFTDTRNLRTYAYIMATLILAVIVFLAMRYYALGYWIGKGPSEDSLLFNPFLHATSTQRFATVLYTWLLYFKLLVIPWPLTQDYFPYHIPLLDFGDFRVWMAMIMVVVLVYGVIRNFKKNPIVSYGILFFAITFFPVSNLVVQIGTFMCERFVFTPLLGFAIIVGYFVQKNSQCEPVQILRTTPVKPLAVVLIFVFLTFSTLTVVRSRAWKNDLTLYTTDVKTSKNSIRANLQAGVILVKYAETLACKIEKQEVLSQAYNYLLKSVQLNPGFIEGWAWLGHCYVEMGRLDEAYRLFEHVFSLNISGEKFRVTALATAEHLKSKGKFEMASRFCVLVARHSNIDGVESAHNFFINSAEYLINEILILQPDNVSVLNDKAEILAFTRRDFSQALRVLLFAHQIDPLDMTINKNLALIYISINDCEQAIHHLRKVLSADPHNRHIQQQLTMLYVNCQVI